MDLRVIILDPRLVKFYLYPALLNGDWTFKGEACGSGFLSSWQGGSGRYIGEYVIWLPKLLESPNHQLYSTSFSHKYKAMTLRFCERWMILW